MLFPNCKQGVLWFSLLSMVLNSPAWAQFRGQGFFGGNGRPFGQGAGQGNNQGQFQPNNRFQAQPAQRPFQQLMQAQGNRQQAFQNPLQQNNQALPFKGLTQRQGPQPFKMPGTKDPQQGVRRPQLPLQNSKIGQRLPGLGGQNGAGKPLQQALPGVNQRPLNQNRPLNLGGKGGPGNPISKAMEQRKDKITDKLPLDGKQPQRPIFTDKRKQAEKGVDPFLANRRPLANPKPIRRSTDLKKFGIDLKPGQKQDQQRLGPQRPNNVAGRFNLLNQNRRPNGPKLAKGIENKMEGILNGAIRANDPKVIQNFRLGRADFADRLVADGALRRFRANNPTEADRDLIDQLGGIAQLIALSASFSAMPDFSTDAGVMEPIDDGGCMLASMLEPVQYLDEGDDLYDDLAESDVAENEELLADYQVQLIHPYPEEAGVDFTIDDGEQSISPGTKSAVALPRGEKGEIRFATGSGATTRYTLTAGETYEFYDKDGYWDLRKKLIDDLPADVPQLNIVQNDAAEEETVAAAAKVAEVAQVVAAKVETATGELADPKTDTKEAAEEKTDLLADVPADATSVAPEEATATETAAVPPVVRKVVGRFAVLNPLENEIELLFEVNGQGRSLAPGKVAILNVIGSETTVAFSNGEQEEPVERTVAVGKAYEFWNNDGMWDLREKEIPQQRIASANPN